jgi:hypothetical protein
MKAPEFSGRLFGAPRQKPGFPLQVLGFANANPVGFPLQSLARRQLRVKPQNCRSNSGSGHEDDIYETVFVYITLCEIPPQIGRKIYNIKILSK